jgi:predicted transcriptional regulator
LKHERRSAIEIRASILAVLDEGALTQTDLMRKANMNHRMVMLDLGPLVLSGLVIRNGRRYFLTAEGSGILQAFRALRNELQLS